MDDNERMRTTIRKYFSSEMVILVQLYILKYEEYYGEKCPNAYYNIANKIKEFCKRHSINYREECDRDWFIENVLDVVFERYDELGYSSAKYPRFSPTHLITDWVIDNIINNVSMYE